MSSLFFSGGGLLVLASGTDKNPERAPGLLRLCEVVSVRDVTNDFRVACLATAVSLTSRLVAVYRDLPAAQEAWQPLLPLLAGMLQQQQLPAQLVAELAALKDAIGNLPKKSGAIVKPAKQVSMA